MGQINLRSFTEQARNVRYAYEQTQRQFDDHPPNNDLVPYRRRHQRLDAYLRLLHGH